MRLFSRFVSDFQIKKTQNHHLPFIAEIVSYFKLVPPVGIQALSPNADLLGRKTPYLDNSTTSMSSRFLVKYLPNPTATGRL